MFDLVLPALFAVFFWWFSTGIVLYISQRPAKERPLWFIMVGAIAACGLVCVVLTARMETVTGVYSAFIATIAVWAFHELSFLYGYITGPNKQDCPKNISEFQRFKAAFATVVYHELALLLTAVIIFTMTFNQPNPTALVTFAILWLMRISAKLNLFAGTPKPALDMMPAHLEYLGTYFKRANVGVLFAVTTTIAAVALGSMLVFANEYPADYQHIAFVLTATFLALALLEHWFFILPFNETKLWTAWFSEPLREKLRRSKSDVGVIISEQERQIR